MEKRVAVVTGSNKGIGLEIVRQLAKHGFTTILTARDEQRGAEAVEALKSQGIHVDFHKLDVSDPRSVSHAVNWLQHTYGALDILVNNAGITSKSYEDRVEGAKAVLETNYYGAKRMIEATLPLMKPGSRIINISSRLGQLENNKIDPLKNEFQREKLGNVNKLTDQTIESCIQEFMEGVRRGKLTEEGYPKTHPDYCMSKYALNAYTRILAPHLQAKQISINCVCPGYTKTDLTGGEGRHTVEEGTDTATWLATLDAQEYPTGKFFAERKETPF